MRLYATVPSAYCSASVGGHPGPGRGHLRTPRARARRQGRRTAENVRRRAPRDRDQLRRRSRVRPAGVQRHPRDARHARPAFQLLRSQGIRADARAPGRPLLRPRDHHRRDRRRHRRAERVRRVAGVQDGRAPRRRHRPDRRRGREGLVDRAGDGQAARAEGHQRPHRDQAPRLRAADSARSHARRSPHPHRARLLHGRCDHRLHPHEGFRREHRPRGARRRCAISPSRA